MTLTSAWIGRGVLRLNYLQMDMDEALHANRGLEFTSALIRNDWPAIKEDFTQPHWYPPGHGVLLGTWFSLVGAGVETARLYSTLCYFIFGVLLWLSMREVVPNAHPLLYLVPPLFLVSDAQHTVYAGLSMLELPAITLAFVALFFLNRALRKRRLLYHALAFSFALLCLFTKYNFGLVVIAAFVFCYAMMLWESFRTSRISREVQYILVLWIIFVLVLGIWFVVLGEWRWLVDYANAQPDRYMLWSQANLFYYPRLLWKTSLNWLAIFLSLAGGIVLLKQRRYLPGLTPYLLFFGLSLVMLSLERQNTPRFGMILYPSLWMTAGVSSYLLTAGLRPRWLRNTGYAALLLLLFLAGANNFRLFMSRFFAEHENANAGVHQAYDFIASILDVSKKEQLDVIMFGRTDQWNGQALGFYLEAQCLQKRHACEINLSDTWELRKGWPTQEFPDEIQRQRLEAALREADYIVNFFEHPEDQAGWELVSERQFAFERLNKKPAQVWVSIYRPMPGEPRQE